MANIETNPMTNADMTTTATYTNPVCTSMFPVAEALQQRRGPASPLFTKVRERRRPGVATGRASECSAGP
jgi:hypothetical protein